MIKRFLLVAAACQGLLCATSEPPRPRENATMSKQAVHEYVMDAVNNTLLPLFTNHPKEKNDRKKADELKRRLREDIYRNAPGAYVGYEEHYYPTDIQQRVISAIMSFVIEKTEKYAWQRTSDRSVVEAVVMTVHEYMYALFSQNVKFDANLRRHVQNYVGVSLRIKVYELVDNRTAYNPPPSYYDAPPSYDSIMR